MNNLHTLNSQMLKSTVNHKYQVIEIATIHNHQMEFHFQEQSFDQMMSEKMNAILVLEINKLSC